MERLLSVLRGFGLLVAGTIAFFSSPAHGIPSSDEASLTLSALSETQVAGVYRRGSITIKFDAQRTDAGLRWALYKTDGQEMFRFEQEGDSAVMTVLGGYKQRVDGATIAKLEANQLDDAGVQSGVVFEGDPTLLYTMQTLEEYAELPRLSRQLGEQGITGASYPVSLPIHLFARSAAKISGIGGLTSSAGSDPGDTPLEMQRTQSVSRALARVQLPGAQHFVQFYQLDDGNIAAYEEGSLEAGDQPVDASSWGHMTLSDIIQQLQPGSVVPAAVQEADRRRAARVRTYKEPTSGPPDEERGVQALRTAQPSELLATASVDPGTDAAWWTQNFCNTEQIYSVWCPTNVTWAHSGWRPTKYYEAAGMSASSVASADFWVEQWQSSGWVRIFSQVAGPRTWWKWSQNGAGTFRSGVDGRSPEPWVHFAERVRLCVNGDLSCDPNNDGCFGMCGDGCDCWEWVCGDCRYHWGCWQHDWFCRHADDFSWYDPRHWYYLDQCYLGLSVFIATVGCFP